MGCCLVPVRHPAQPQKTPGGEVRVSPLLGGEGSLAPTRPLLTPPERAGRILGLSGGVEASAPLSHVRWEPGFPVTSDWSAVVPTGLFCLARWPLPVLWQRAGSCNGQRFWVARSFSLKLGSVRPSPHCAARGDPRPPPTSVSYTGFYSTSRGPSARSACTTAEAWQLSWSSGSEVLCGGMTCPRSQSKWSGLNPRPSAR